MEMMKRREGEVMAKNSRSELTSIFGKSSVIFEALEVFNARNLDPYDHL